MRQTHGFGPDNNVVAVHHPVHQSNPLIFSSPHSGRFYPEDLLTHCRAPLKVLRRSEDAYVDEVYSDAPQFGALFIEALFPRAFVDPNRARTELDPDMIELPVMPEIGRVTSRAAAGLGVLPRVSADGRALYSDRMSHQQAYALLKRFYDPYHDTLKAAIARTRKAFGQAIVIDCHSMPAASARGADIVLGDRFGTSCSRALISTMEYQLRDLGFSVVRNRPYAGGYTTEFYGHPEAGVHVVQVELNRSLYLDEVRVTPTSGLGMLKETINTWISAFTKTHLPHKIAAE